MPYVKAVPLSRIAGSALKSFTHGYAQTVVAASQSSYAAQNTANAVSLTDSLAGRFRKAERSRVHNVYLSTDGARHATTSSTANARPETSHTEAGLEKYLDAWQKHQPSGEAKEWQQFQFARTIEWHPPTVVLVHAQDAAAEEPVLEKEQAIRSAPPLLKRSYTTSALDNFNKAFDHDEGLEADALEQVNNKLTEESLRSKEDAEDNLLAKASPVASVSQDLSASQERIASTPATALRPTESFSSEADLYANELLQLSEDKQHDRVPAAFHAMLRAGVQQPSPAAYRALLSSAIALTPGKHARVPRALEVYSDMLRRKVQPDTETYSTLVGLLADRALLTVSMRRDLEARLARYGGLERSEKFMFRSSESEYNMLTEDNSLSIALKLFDRAILAGHRVSVEASASLVAACAEQGRLQDMSRIHHHMQSAEVSTVYPPMIVAFGKDGDLNSAVNVYDQYKGLCVANNAGENDMSRIDNEIYAALVKAYGSADRLKGGLKFLASVQAETMVEEELLQLREVVTTEALLPLALKDETFKDAFDLASSLTGRALTTSLATITTTAADANKLEVAQAAFDKLAEITQDLSTPAAAMLAMHIRNAKLEAAEPFWSILESASADASLIEPSTMRAVALIGVGQAERGLRQTCRMFARIRDQQPESSMAETIEQIDEALELTGAFVLKSNIPIAPAASAELLRMMAENGGLIAPIADHIVARLSMEHIARLNAADLELLLHAQADMILHESLADIAGTARFGALLETLVSRSIMPSSETEAAIEKTLINVGRDDLSRLWNSYRYPVTPAFTPAAFTPVLAQAARLTSVQPSFEDVYDPYAARTDVKGSNAINDLLERPPGRRMNEALTKFKNMRRIGRVPRMFTYGKIIEAAAKDNNLNLAHDILEMAKQDVPFDARYRVVRFGWQQILDHMVAGCLTMGRRDLAAKYHQGLIDMGAAPSANTFGLYITTLKENTKTFDEASEAVKIFIRAKAEGVEPSSFLYNALIGKLGKARRIDDCLFYFAEMRNLGIRPTSVTYGTIVNALCRVSDEKFAEEIFEEMETCANYKPRPAPYHSLMQYFLGTKRDRSKVLAYYERMRSKGIEPTVHTYKLLIDTHATLEPINLVAAESVLSDMQASGIQPEAVHYASLIHAKGCVTHDMPGAQSLFDSVLREGRVRPQPCLYQALFESLNANHALAASADALLSDMRSRHVEFTPYIANALIHGWTQERNLEKAKEAFARVPANKREPSTYEAMVRGYMAAEQRDAAGGVVREALRRGYPSAVASKIAELVR
ncbi:hypothetical protein LTR62_003966 [Meristemomyces frigidus]|uniref:Tetratricopeptide repeat domain-containing protein n=1 Tax=Meristemomyces frigidus TaxID=1508187 RepID=A0AAN7TEC4_9PEZI|nr:hypothetical protein LTR62_003966 [Meristemomyces frigidus]